MEEVFVGAKEDFQDGESLPCNLGKKIGVSENNHFLFAASELKRVLEMAIQEQSLTKDTKQIRMNKRCLLETNLQNQCGREHRFPKYASFVSLNENLVRRCLDLVDVRGSDSLSIICRTAPFNIPVNLSSSKMDLLFDSLEPHKRRSRSTSDLNKFVTEPVFSSGPENVVFSSFGQKANDRIEENGKVCNQMKSPLVHHLGALDSNSNLGKDKSTDLKDKKCLEMVSSPSVQSTSSLQERVAENTPLRRQRYGSDCSGDMVLSFSGTNSTSSLPTTSSTGSAASVGMIHCKWKGGLPYFVFSTDDRGDIYAANPCKVESSEHKDFDFIYSFLSTTGGKKERGASADNVSNLVGKMKVSSSVVLGSNNSKLMETEFVLFGVSEVRVEEIEGSIHSLQKNKGLPKKVVDIFRTNHSAKNKYSSRFADARTKPKYLSWESYQGVLGKENMIDNLPPNLELAAIVVKEYCHENSQKAAVGGWGLKFLEKFVVNHPNTSLSSSESWQGTLEVLIPAGFHGGPRTRSGGPSSLTERWRSGGHCDCGGWDVGCPLTVLNNRSSYATNSSEIEEESCKSFDLFREGANNQGFPTLKMVNIHEGLYFVHYQPNLSALQSFSIGVAIIHSKSPALFPQMYRH